jgi:hypothetical protein
MMRGAGGGVVGLGAVTLLVVGLLMTPVLVWAAHPDPLWIPGVYDGGDADELVLTLLRTHGVEPVIDRESAPALTPVATVDLPLLPGAARRPLAPPRPRAPPVSA